LIVNPIAGIGGRVGLKGSDGFEIQQRAHQLGAEPMAGKRAAEALAFLHPLADTFDLFTPPGLMGETTARQCGFDPRIIPLPHPLSYEEEGETSAADTCKAARLMREHGVDLILFAGGDGTARDLYEALGEDFPVLGIPAGVKIYSAVFGTTPHSAGALAAEFMGGKRIQLQQVEVLDIDEEAFRNEQINTRLYGYLTIPHRRGHIQNQKVPTPASEAVQAQAIAADIIQRMVPGKAYLLGPGTSTRAIAQQLGLPKTLVGVDILTKETSLLQDANEALILNILSKLSVGLIITPTG